MPVYNPEFIEVEDEGVAVATRPSLNFEGDGVTASDNPTEGRVDVAIAPGGVSDHGALTGLGDDDHSQYHNDARGDARYYTETELNAGQLDTRYYTETEVDALLSAHVADSSAHHARYTDAEAVTAVEGEATLDLTGAVTIAGAYLGLKTNGELRFYDNGNYVGFEAPALGADQIWVLPTADGNASDALTTNGSGVLSWAASAGGSLDAAYDIGSTVTVDNTDIIFNLVGAHNFKIQDGGADVHVWDGTGIYTITMSAAMANGIVIDGATNDYTGAANPYAIRVTRDFFTPHSAVGHVSYGLSFIVTDSHNLHDASGTTQRLYGTFAQSTQNGAMTGATTNSKINTYGISGSIVQGGVTTASGVNQLNTYGTETSIFGIHHMNNAAGTLNVYLYGGYYKVQDYGALIAGTKNAYYYGFYADVTGGVAGTSVAYGAWVKAAGADTNTAGYFEAANFIFEFAGAAMVAAGGHGFAGTDRIIVNTPGGLRYMYLYTN